MVALEVEVETEKTNEQLDDELCALAAQIAAATCRFILLISELDRRRAWAQWGARSMAHWLSYRCGLSLSTGREHVRVGRAIEDLPEIRDAFAKGEISYSKVRAIVRIAEPETEATMLELARFATASQLEHIVSSMVTATRGAATSQLEQRRVRIRREADGAVTLIARLTADQYAVVDAAISRAVGDIPSDEAADDPVAARRADALEHIAQAYVGDADVDAPRADMVVHAELDDLCDEDKGEVLRSLACDARITLSVEDHGRPVAVGPPQESIPAKTRRLVAQRDKNCCRFPGCTNRRYLHIHHIVHRVRHGTHDRDNLLTLCTFHHRLVHVGGWRVHGDADGDVVFISPRGRRLRERAPDVPATTASLPSVNSQPITMAEGVRMDLALACDAIFASMADSR